MSNETAAAAAPTEAPPPAPPAPKRKRVSGEDLYENTVLLNLITERPGNRAAVNTDDSVKDDLDVDKTEMHVDIRLLSGPELTAARSLLRSVTARIRAPRGIALPDNSLRPGLHRVAIDTVPDLEKLLADYKKRLAGLVEECVAVLPRMKNEAFKKHGKLYDESRMPTADDLRNHFVLDHSYEVSSTPGSLQRISKHLFAREEKKAAAKLDNAIGEIKLGFAKTLLGFLQHVTGKLTPGKPGEKKLLTQAAIDRMEEFLAMFDRRNVVGDLPVKQAVERVRRVMKGLDAQGIRSDAGVQERVAKEFTTLAARLDTLVQTRSRGVELDD